MSMRPVVLGGIALLLFLGLSPGHAGATPQEAEAAPAVNCGDCHEQSAKFTGNPHAKHAVHEGQVASAVCESCHGNGAAHAEAGGDTSLIQVPRGVEGANKICLSCHNRMGAHASPLMGVHANGQAVNCLTCHEIHEPAQHQKLLTTAQPELCGTCHGEKTASFRNMPYAHRLGRASLACSTCHNPHGRAGEENLRRTNAGEVPCLGCHSDKRGPFVFQHGSVAAGECWTCHEPHGSAHPHQLKRPTVMQVCIECHSPTGSATLGSQPPSFHNLLNPRYQNCTTCHVAVHGSNRSPVLMK